MKKEKREHVSLKRIVSYDPYNEKADYLDQVHSWAAFDSFGNSVAWGDTKTECIREARRAGYVPDL